MSETGRTNEELLAALWNAWSEQMLAVHAADQEWVKRSMAVVNPAYAAVLSRMTPGWQSIETAPKDGSEILLCDHGDVYAGHWSTAPNYRSWSDPNGNWFAEMDRSSESTAKPQRPTHWMPLLAAPPSPSHKEGEQP